MLLSILAQPQTVRQDFLGHMRNGLADGAGMCPDADQRVVDVDAELERRHTGCLVPRCVSMMFDPVDEQSGAEQFDEEVTGLERPVTSDEVRPDYPPDHLEGVPFADTDVTDESFEDRLAQEQPEQTS